MQARQKSFTLEILLSHGKITRLGSPRKQPTFYIISLDILSFHTCPSVPERPEVEILEVSRGRVSQGGGVCMFANTCFLASHPPHCDVLYYLGSVFFEAKVGWLLHTRIISAKTSFSSCVVFSSHSFYSMYFCSCFVVMLHTRVISAKLITHKLTSKSCLLFCHC